MIEYHIRKMQWQRNGCRWYVYVNIKTDDEHEITRFMFERKYLAEAWIAKQRGD